MSPSGGSNDIWKRFMEKGVNGVGKQAGYARFIHARSAIDYSYLFLGAVETMGDFVIMTGVDSPRVTGRLFALQNNLRHHFIKHFSNEP